VSLVHNERTKLTASWFNGLATALVAAGLFAPLVAMAYGISDMRSGGPYIVVLMVGCVGGGLLLHWTGRGILRRLRE
jgi:Na+/melibiose symporter-like transporter